MMLLQTGVGQKILPYTVVRVLAQQYNTYHCSSTAVH